MAATSGYPNTGAVVRGDPLVIPVNISVDGVPYIVSGSDWRAQVRSNFDAALVVSFTCTTAIPAGGTVENQVVMSMTGDETALLKQGMVFDLEELDAVSGDTIRTWWICTGIKIQPDVSRDDPGPITGRTAVAPQPAALTKAQALHRVARA